MAKQKAFYRHADWQRSFAKTTSHHCLPPEFFERVPTEQFIGEGVQPENLNQGVLGRALDDLFEYVDTELFRNLEARTAEKLGLTSRFAHLDATSFSFHGDYDSEERPKLVPCSPKHTMLTLNVEAGYRTVFTIDRPMSRKIPDFRHVILNLIQNLSEFADAVARKITDGRRCAG